ncbi:flagellar hook-length control protein FliK [Celerinatantimonas sp. YJH-8]|uniref:flagellar hook-length control protein FliK n=1 Tax=Celerinatantimonas sp. YJH-8 TaxID=3228714 RepID=UPI0038BF3A2D
MATVNAVQPNQGPSNTGTGIGSVKSVGLESFNQALGQAQQAHHRDGRISGGKSLPARVSHRANSVTSVQAHHDRLRDKSPSSSPQVDDKKTVQKSHSDSVQSPSKQSDVDDDKAVAQNASKKTEIPHQSQKTTPAKASVSDKAHSADPKLQVHEDAHQSAQEQSDSKSVKSVQNDQNITTSSQQLLARLQQAQQADVSVHEADVEDVETEDEVSATDEASQSERIGTQTQSKLNSAVENAKKSSDPQGLSNETLLLSEVQTLSGNGKGDADSEHLQTNTATEAEINADSIKAKLGADMQAIAAGGQQDAASSETASSAAELSNSELAEQLQQRVLAGKTQSSDDKSLSSDKVAGKTMHESSDPKQAEHSEGDLQIALQAAQLLQSQMPQKDVQTDGQSVSDSDDQELLSASAARQLVNTEQSATPRMAGQVISTENIEQAADSDPSLQKELKAIAALLKKEQGRDEKVDSTQPIKSADPKLSELARLASSGESKPLPSAPGSSTVSSFLADTAAGAAGGTIAKTSVEHLENHPVQHQLAQAVTQQLNGGQLSKDMPLQFSADQLQQASAQTGATQAEQFDKLSPNVATHAASALAGQAMLSEHKGASDISHQRAIAASVASASAAISPTDQAHLGSGSHNPSFGQQLAQNQGMAANTAAASRSDQPFNQMSMQNPNLSQELNEKVNYLVSNKIQSADIRLDPAHLGMMQIRLNLQHDQAQVQIHVHNPQARDMLEQTLPKLRDMLAQQGIQLGQSQISHQQGGQSNTPGHAFNQSSQHQPGSPFMGGMANAGELEAEELHPSMLYRRAAVDDGIDYYA